MIDEEKLRMGFSPRAQCIICGTDTGFVEDGKPHICAICYSNEEHLEQRMGMAIA